MKKDMEYFLDDNFVIPDWIEKMTPEERQAEIERLEKEAFKRKQEIMKNS